MAGGREDYGVGQEDRAIADFKKMLQDQGVDSSQVDAYLEENKIDKGESFISKLAGSGLGTAVRAYSDWINKKAIPAVGSFLSGLRPKSAAEEFAKTKRTLSGN